MGAVKKGVAGVAGAIPPRPVIVKRVARVANPHVLLRSKSGAAIVVAPDPSDLGFDGTIVANTNIGVQGFQISDINQGQLDDCYFLAALGGLAAKCPKFLINRVSSGANGSLIFAVVVNGAPEDVEVDNKVNGWYCHTANASQDDFAAIFEKLFAFLRSSANTMADTDWGNPAQFWTVFGVPTVQAAPASSQGADIAAYQAQIAAALANPNQVVTGSTTDGGIDKLIASHSYAILSLSADGKSVNTYNPWGNQTPGGNPYQSWPWANFASDFPYCVIATVPAAAVSTPVVTPTPVVVPAVPAVPVVVAPTQPPDFVYVSNTIPATLAPGQHFNFLITIKNTGWGQPGQKLVSTGTLAVSSGDLPTIPYAREGSVSFSGTAPATAGDYTVVLRGSDNGAAFGPMLSQVVKVAAVPSVVVPATPTIKTTPTKPASPTKPALPVTPSPVRVNPAAVVTPAKAVTTPSTPAVSGANTVPGLVDASCFFGGLVKCKPDHNTPDGAGDIGWVEAGATGTTQIDVGTGGSYDVGVLLAAAGPTTAHVLVTLDGKQIGVVEPVQTGEWSAYTACWIFGVAITAGRHVLGFYSDAAGLNLRGFDFRLNVPVSSGTAATIIDAPAARGSTINDQRPANVDRRVATAAEMVRSQCALVGSGSAAHVLLRLGSMVEVPQDAKRVARIQAGSTATAAGLLDAAPRTVRIVAASPGRARTIAVSAAQRVVRLVVPESPIGTPATVEFPTPVIGPGRVLVACVDPGVSIFGISADGALVTPATETVA